MQKRRKVIKSQIKPQKNGINLRKYDLDKLLTVNHKKVGYPLLMSFSNLIECFKINSKGSSPVVHAESIPLSKPTRNI